MAKQFKTVILKITTEKGKTQLIRDLEKKAEIRNAIQSKTPIAEIENKFEVKFATPL